MKRIISAVSLILLLVAVFATPADASTGFTLADGVVEFTSAEVLSNTILDFWKNLRIEFDDVSKLGGEVHAEGEGKDTEDGLFTHRAIGKIDGFYDPSTGRFWGTYVIDLPPDEMESTNIILRYRGKFYKYLETGENPVKLDFYENTFGWATAEGLDESKESDLKFTVTFNVEGRIQLVEATPTMTFPDSGARFSDLAGEVEYLLPRGLKPNGQYDYNEEAWDSCELEMVLPEGTLIRTARNSTAIISFADMTTFVTKPETSIILGRPADPDSQFQLLVGGLWINVKKMIKDGSMEIEMNQEWAGIKGTTLVLEDDGTTSTVKVIEGTVEVTAKADGKSRMVGAGSMLSADSRGLGELRTFDIAAESASWPQVTAVDTGNVSAAEPGEPDVVVLPYGSEAEELAPDAAEEPGPRIGLILGIYFFVAVILVAVVVVIVLLTRRKKRL